MHKGRTTQTPWDPALVQKAFATSPASQAISTKYCSRKSRRAVWSESGAYARGANRRFCPDSSRDLRVVVILGEGLEEGHEGGHVRLADGHVLKFGRGIAQKTLARELRVVDVELDDVVEGELAAVVEIGSRVFEIAEHRRLELGDCVRQALVHG